MIVTYTDVITQNDDCSCYSDPTLYLNKVVDAFPDLPET